MSSPASSFNSLTTEDGIQRIRAQIESLSQVTDRELAGWKSRTSGILERLFGANSRQLQTFSLARASQSPSELQRAAADPNYDRRRIINTDTIRAVLESFVEELQDFGSPLNAPLLPSVSASATENKLDVLISWSRSQSHELGSALCRWIPDVLTGVTPWMSDRDIEKGADWWIELKDLLSRTKMCIICVTKENVTSPWLYFETGAIAVKGPGARVCPYLLGIDPENISNSPLGKFQVTSATKDDTRLMIASLNKQLGDRWIDSKLLNSNFDLNWHRLEADIARIQSMHISVKEKLVESDVVLQSMPRLSEHASELLLTASKASDARILWIDTDQGVFLLSNGRQFGGDGPRDQAAWRKAVSELSQLGLIERNRGRGTSFSVTDAGFKVAASLT